MPQSWGGGTEIENLQPMCEECNGRQADYYQSSTASRTDPPGHQLCRAAAANRRAARGVRGRVGATDLLCHGRSAQEFQEDSQRRLRDLRFSAGIRAQEATPLEGFSRIWVVLPAQASAPWPDNIHEAITAEERRRKEPGTETVVSRQPEASAAWLPEPPRSPS